MKLLFGCVYRGSREFVWSQEEEEEEEETAGVRPGHTAWVRVKKRRRVTEEI